MFDKPQRTSSNSAVHELGVFSIQPSGLNSEPNRSVDNDHQGIDGSDRVMTSNVLYCSCNERREIVSNALYNMESTDTNEKQMNHNELYEPDFAATDLMNPGSSTSVTGVKETFQNEIYLFADPITTNRK